MPDRDRQDLLESLAQTRAILEDFHSLGLSELYLPPADLGGGKQAAGSTRDGGSDREGRAETLEDIRSDLEGCGRCPLCQGGKQIVFGAGRGDAELVFVGEAPGREEDESGEPFVGEAGRLLDSILFAMGMDRQDVYLCNVEKFRPPKNREPLSTEVEACEPFLKRQLAAIRPRLIVALGRLAAQTLLKSDAAVSDLRGKWHQYEGVPLMPTYHPSYLLRNPASKKEVWEDMKQVVRRLRQSV